MNMKWYSYIFWIAGSVSLSCLATPTLTQAQSIEADTTLTPNNSIVTPQPDNIFEIVGGVEAESNLFHSFREFSVTNGSTAYFNNAASIQNIISRVTGGSVSNINGLIRANGSANLFLLNPNGIIFGPNAQLNIGGSFLASTATNIVFADGNFFRTTAPQTTPLLTISIPVGLEYRSNAGSIVNRSTAGLQVQPGKNLALVGGQVQLNGGVLTAPGGRVELGGLAESGTVGLRVDGNNLRLSFPDNVALADVSLTNQAKVGVVSFGGGNIALDAQNLEISESQLLAGIEEGLGSVGSQAGDITINATEAVTVTDSRIVNNVEFEATGNAGNINIKAKSVFIDDSRLEVNTFGQGNAGSIFIQANDFVSLNGITTVQSNIDAKEAEGNGGELDIQARSLSLTDGAQLQVRTRGRGNAGNVTIAVRDTITIAGEDSDGFNSGISSIVREGAEGNGGTIDIQARSLSLTGGSQLSASVFRTDSGLPGGRGKGGDIIVNASDSVNISGVGLDGFSSGIFADTGKGAVGPAGNIIVNTNFFRIADGATVNAETENSGSGGNIGINANTFEAINGGQLITAANSSGNAGSITVNATDRVTISGSDPTFADRLAQFGTRVSNVGAGSGLFARSDSSAAGNVTINAPQLGVQEGAEVTVSSPQGQAGNLTINANSLSLNRGSITAETGKSEGEEGANITLKISDLLRIENESPISARANGSADGGNIDIDTPSLIVFPPTGSNGSDIIAKAQEGNGGRIAINAQGIFGIRERQATPGNQTNDLDASSESGSTGEILLNRELDPNRGLVELPETVVDPDALVAQNPCKRGSESEFVITGRGGLPPSLSEDLSSDATQVGLVEPAPMESRGAREQESREAEEKTNSPPSVPTPIIPAQGWVFNDKGEVVLVAYDPTVTGPQRLKKNLDGCLQQWSGERELEDKTPNNDRDRLLERKS